MNRIEKIVLILFALLMPIVFFGGSFTEGVDMHKAKKTETQIIATVPTPITTPLPTSSPIPPEVQYYTEDEVIMVAKVLYDECRGVNSDTEKACVVWTICNRVDAGYGSTITEVVTAKNQFAYRRNAPVLDELYALAEDVLVRWNSERNGALNVGRVLPEDYMWYSGDGQRNYFRNHYNAAYGYWDYSTESPYES